MKVKKKKVLKVKKEPKSDELALEICGEVFIVEKYKGKEVKRTVLEGELVLKCLINCLERGINSLAVEHGIKEKYNLQDKSKGVLLPRNNRRQK
jgi:hypothetical protein